ncbi:methyltransferase [Amycolatopsis acidicola]|uniref:Methyltransferase n=1 Tax=Amycolatopsis acidicola TaxID=2596893 RepID=A0A5N0UX57_9PSEU|nr:SAM-dependent methyltransferase [Amycolatopsis acidicola]KAA9157958.1 methyltransferase [Amycolatopsis acidicola]
MNDEKPSWPPEVDLDHPNAARVYDYLLGGVNHWAIDRLFGEKAVAVFPTVRQVARLNREFVQRAVLYLMDSGVRQFLDLGSGIPTVGNVHEIADVVDPTSRVAYVDNEAVAVAHSRVLLEQHGDRERHAFVQHDLLEPDVVWEKACGSDVLDPAEPVGLVCGAVLHFLPDVVTADAGIAEDARVLSTIGDVMARYRELLPKGSAMAVSHVTDDGIPAEVEPEIRGFVDLYQESSTPAYFRSAREIQKFFGQFTLDDPGLAWIPDWHPELDWRQRARERLARNQLATHFLLDVDLDEIPATRLFQGRASSSCVLGAVGWKR